MYVDMAENGNFLNFDSANRNITPLAQSQDVHSSCNDIVPVTIPLETDTEYKIWYIVGFFLSLAQPATDWVHVGEVQFIGTSSQPPPQPAPK